MTERQGNTATKSSDADLEPQPKVKGKLESTRQQLPLRQSSGAGTDVVAVPHTPVDEDQLHERGTAPKGPYGHGDGSIAFEGSTRDNDRIKPRKANEPHTK